MSLEDSKKIVNNIDTYIDKKIDDFKPYVKNAIRDYKVGPNQIRQGAITSLKLAANSIYTRHYTANSITAEILRAHIITSDHLTLSAQASVTTSNRNILLDSVGLVESETYLIAEFDTTGLLPSTNYTIVLEGIANEGQEILAKFNDGVDGTISAPFDAEGICVIRTVTPSTITNDKIRLYNYPSLSAVNSQIMWACMYKGYITSPPHDYTPTIEEIDTRLNANADAISDLATTVSSKTTIFYQTTAPTTDNTGDMWYDTDASPVQIYRWNGSSWDNITSNALAAALTAAADAQSTADGKIVTYAQVSAPTGANVGDLWIDTDDGNKMYRYNGSSWLSVQDGLLQTHSSAISSITSGLSGKTTIFYQTSQPTATTTGDVWYDTDANPVVIYRWTGSAWSDITNSALSAALTAAGSAQATADGKIVSFLQATAPIATSIGDLWTDTDDNNKLYRWSGSAWVSVQDTHNDSLVSSHSSAISSITSSLNAKTTIFYQISQPTATAAGDIWYDTDANPVKIYRWSGSAWTDITSTALASALTAAADAQATADGKIKTYAQTSAPTGMTANDVGDLWVDTDDSNKLYRYSGSAWVAVQDTHNDSTLASHASSISSLTTTLSSKTTIYYQTSAPTTTVVGDVWYDTDATPTVKIYRWTGSSWTDITSAALSAALAAAEDAQSTADGKIVTFAQPTMPTATAIGDLWIDTDDNNQLYRWSGGAWDAVRDGNISILTNSITALNTYLNSSITIFYQTTQPTATATGDVWYDTDSSPVVIRRWTGTAWIDITTTSLAQSLKAAADAQSTADGKIRTFAQDTAPTGMTAGDVGDLWIDTNDGNKLYRWNGTAWAIARDATLDNVDSIISDYDGASGTLTDIARNTAYIGSLPPTVPADHPNWINTGVYPPEQLHWTENSTNTARSYAASKSGPSVPIKDPSNDRALDITAVTVSKQAAGTPALTSPLPITGYSSITFCRSGKNCRRYGDLTTDTTGWVLSTGVSRDATVKIGNSNSIKFNVTGLSTNEFRAASAITSERVRVANGDIITASCQIYMTDYTTFGGLDLALELVPYDISGNIIGTQIGVTLLTPTSAHNNVTTPISVTATISSATIAYIDAVVWVRRNGVFWVIQPQTEYGATSTAYEAYNGTDYTMTPAVPVYGTSAVADSVSIAGGIGHNTGYLYITGSEASWYDAGNVGATTKLYAVSLYTTGSTTQTTLTGSICNRAADVGSQVFTTGTYQDTGSKFCVRRVSGTNDFRLFIRVPTALCADLTAFKNWLGTNPLQVVFRRETPVIESVAPVKINGLDGVTVVSTNATSMTVNYIGSGWEVVGGKANSLYASATQKFDADGLEITQTYIDGVPVDCVHRIGADRDGYYKASTGEFIGGLTVKGEELHVAASALSDPRVTTNFVTKIFTEAADVGDPPGWYYLIRHGLDMKYSNNTIGRLYARGYMDTGVEVEGEGAFCIDSADDIPIWIENHPHPLTWNSISMIPGGINITAETSTTSAGIRLDSEANTVYVVGGLRPSSNGANNLGFSGNRWKEVFATVGSINTSDEREKHDITNIDSEQAIKFAMAVNPIWFRHNCMPESLMAGFTTQDILRASELAGLKEDCGIIYYDKNDPSVIHGLRSDQLISLLYSVVQSQQYLLTDQAKTLVTYKESIASLEERVSKLESAIMSNSNIK